MQHYMKLQMEPFMKIAAGIKRIEIRLFDEKRAGIKVGDTIIFSQMDNPSLTLNVKVTDLVRFETFKDLFMEYGMEHYESMYQYYSRDGEQKYGVLAIHIENEKTA